MTGKAKVMNRIFFALVSMILANLALSPAVQAQNQAEGKKLYLSYCTTCHGDTGKGDGMAGSSLPVKPADHTNGAVMNKLSDAFLINIISKGGSGAGKSSFMPSWSGALTDQQIRDIVAYIRSLAVPPYRP
jgi:mono/diheme cytochrome c family protein